MWIRDALPQDLPKARIITIGYDSELAKSESVQNVRMLAGTLRNSIAAIRSNPVS
jgi:hypothetical protein